MKYKRLAVSKRGLGKWHSLWMGDDHLLAVESTGYSEEYARFYFKDIQAIIGRRNGIGRVLNGIFGSMAVVTLLAGIGGYRASSTAGIVVSAIFGSLFILLLLWNILRGPTCRCQVRTLIGTDDLPALDRVKSVKKVLDTIRPLIAQEQGEISREMIIELTGRAEDWPLSSPAAAAPRSSAIKGGKAETPDSSYRGGFHLAAFGVLIIDSVVSLCQINQSPDYLNNISIALTSIFMILAVIALIKQARCALPSLAKLAIWGGVATIAAGFVTGQIFGGFLALDDIQRGMSANNYVFDVATIAASHPLFALYLLVYALLEAALGIFGLIAFGAGRGGTERARA